MISSSPHEFSAMKRKPRLAASQPAMPVSLSVTDTKRKRPATSMEECKTRVSKEDSGLFKRRKTSSPSQEEEFTPMSKKRKLENEQLEEFTSVIKKGKLKNDLLKEFTPVSKQRKLNNEESEEFTPVKKKRKLNNKESEEFTSVSKKHKLNNEESEEFTPVSKKRKLNEQQEAEISLTTSGCRKKRSAPESPSRSAKRTKIHLTSRDVQTPAVTRKGEDRTDGAAAKVSKTTVDSRKKTPAPDTKATQSLSSSKRHQTKKIKQVKSRQRKPRKFSREEIATARLLLERGVPFLKKSVIKNIASGGMQRLGSGAYGTCHIVVHPKTKERLVIKTFTSDALMELAREAINMHELQFPGMQRLVGVCVPTRQVITVFAGTTLEKYFGHIEPSFADTLKIFLQLSQTLQHMLHKGFCHNDIKGDNICILRENNGPKVNIIDLGFVHRIGTSKIFEYNPDTYNFSWLAPELHLHTHPCSEASDVYSLAKLMQEELSYQEQETTPGQSPSRDALNKWIQRAQYINPRDRPRLSELIELLQVLHKQATQENNQ